MDRRDAIRTIRAYSLAYVKSDKDVEAKYREGRRLFADAIQTLCERGIERTKAKCPGCGGECIRDVDRVCERCQHRFTSLDAFIKRAEKLKRDFVPFQVERPEAEALAYLEGEIEANTRHFSTSPKHYALGDGYGIGAALMTIIMYLGEEILPEAREMHVPGLPQSCHDGRYDNVQRAIPRDAADAVELLDKHIRAALTAAYINGFEKGKDMLGGLASGTLSMSDFEEEVRAIAAKRVIEEEPKPKKKRGKRS